MDERSRRWPHLAPRHWIGLLAILLATVGTFYVLKLTLQTDSQGAAMASRSAGGLWTLATATPPIPEEAQAPSLLVGGYDPDAPVDHLLLKRFFSIPQWFSWTLFQPIRVGMGFGAPGMLIDYGTGLLAMAMLGLAAFHGARRRQFLWLGVLIYIIGLAMNWPQVNNRYLVPVAPFLIGGILTGLGHLMSHRPQGLFRRLGAVLRWAFVVAVLAVNLGLWAVDVWVFRSPSAEDFYARYEAGVHRPLIEIGLFLAREDQTALGRTVASERYENLHERWQYKLAPRAILLLAGPPVGGVEEVGSVPKQMTGWGVRKAQSWARATNVHNYVQQNPTVPGRIWHFRLTPEEHEAITGYAPAPERPQFELYQMLPDPIEANPDLRSLKYRPVPPPDEATLEQMTRHVPGIDPWSH